MIRLDKEKKGNNKIYFPQQRAHTRREKGKRTSKVAFIKWHRPFSLFFYFLLHVNFVILLYFCFCLFPLSSHKVNRAYLTFCFPCRIFQQQKKTIRQTGRDAGVNARRAELGKQRSVRYKFLFLHKSCNGVPPGCI